MITFYFRNIKGITMTYQNSLKRKPWARFRSLLLVFILLTLIVGILMNNQCTKPHAWIKRSADLRQQMWNILTLPTERIPLNAVVHRFIEDEDYRIEMITYASEPNSRVTALLCLPENIDKPVPAIVVACGHGGSKSAFYAQYAGQLYSKLGYACLVVDTIGEEEREATGRMGARGHDLYYLGDENPEFIRTKLKRMVLGKIVWDLMRGIDYLETRKEVDKDRIGIVGYSLGGATVGCVAILDERIKASVICGWAFRGRYATETKYCTRMPYAGFKKIMRFDEMTALLAPNSATLFICGTKDSVIDRDGGATMVYELKMNIEGAKQILVEAKVNGTIDAEFVPEAGHRPFFLSHTGVSWMQKYLMLPERRRQVPAATVSFGEWVDSHGKSIEKLYNTEKNERGLQAVDCGAVLREPKELACFPGRDVPDSEYTMQGWVKATVEANQQEEAIPELMQ